MEKEDYYEISGLHFFSDYSSSKESIIILRVKDGKLEVIAERLFGGLVLEEIPPKKAEEIKKSYGNPRKKSCFLLIKEE